MKYNEHLEGVKKKHKTRKNVMAKIARDVTPMYSRLQLVYSVTEYCAPVRIRSTHYRKVDVKLNQTMRILSGTIKSTQNECSPILSNIAPLDLRQQSHTIKMLKKLSSLPNLSLQINIL